MIATRKKANSNIILYLLLVIILNYLLLNYLLSPHSIATPIAPSNIQSHTYPLINQVPIGHEIENVPAISQLPLLPTGCEAAAAAMFLQWSGIDITMSEIADRLPKGPLPTNHDGKLVGGNPNTEFVGNPFLSTGLGVYNQPIFDALDYYLPHKVQNVTGCSFEDLLKILDSNRPIVVWATIDMKEPTINSVWEDVNGNEVIWKVPEHAMVLVGYTDTAVMVNDPLSGKKITYDQSIFKKCWEAMGSQAITKKVA